VVCDGLELTFYEQAYGDPNYGKFWGGNTPTASWLSRDSIEQCFRHFGYELTVHEDNRHHASLRRHRGNLLRRERVFVKLFSGASVLSRVQGAGTEQLDVAASSALLRSYTQ
jgi:hypothetical protein